MKNLVLLFSVMVILSACSSSTTKENINKVGDVTGQAVGSLVKGVYHGVQKAFDVHVDINKNLTDKEINFGKTTVKTDSLGNDNLLVVYIIFNNDFTGNLTAKAFDNKGLEMGRVTLSVDGKKDEAKYFEFHFDKNTAIQSDSKLTID